MNYKDNNPNYNVNSKIKSFGQFCANLPGEKEKQMSLLRTYSASGYEKLKTDIEKKCVKLEAFLRKSYQDKFDFR